MNREKSCNPAEVLPSLPRLSFGRHGLFAWTSLHSDNCSHFLFVLLKKKN